MRAAHGLARRERPSAEAVQPQGPPHNTQHTTHCAVHGTLGTSIGCRRSRREPPPSSVLSGPLSTANLHARRKLHSRHPIHRWDSRGQAARPAEAAVSATIPPASVNSHSHAALLAPFAGLPSPTALPSCRVAPGPARAPRRHSVKCSSCAGALALSLLHGL